ncbi:MAG: flavin reductase family protein [Eubacteriaceae bacterium]|nr:flavin reductase family protein [Eubacteriaceae bacterium]
MKEFNVSAFEIFDKKWALVTAGNAENYNTMTISWGGLGTLWGKSVATVYVRPSRYTYDFMEKNDYFTVSFYGEEYKKDLGILGSKSGRDIDKVALTKLTPKAVGESMSFEQAQATLLCKKIYHQDLIEENIPKEAIEKYYGPAETIHRMYIGEVIEVIR